EACMSLAGRNAAKGDWNAGAELLQASQPKRAELWREAAKLSADTSSKGLLAWARFLREHNGKLFYDQDKTWYRSLNFRLDALKPQPGAESKPSENNSGTSWDPEAEAKAIQVHLTDSTEMYFALKAYAAWLKAEGAREKESATVLQEADKTYNWLVNWDNSNSSFWTDYLKNSGEAATLRAVGKALHP